MENKNFTYGNNLNRGTEDEMVTTLDGRVISKKDIKIGEIYINSEGKKVRKVVKKIIKTSIAKKEPEPQQTSTPAMSPLGEENKLTQKSPEEINAARLAALKSMGRIPEKSATENGQKSESTKPETADKSANTSSSPLQDSNTLNLSPAEIEKAQEEEQKAPQAPKTFLERVNSKHAFLDKLKNNERISGTPVVSATATQGVEVRNDSIDENVGPDSSVEALETAVVDENYANSIGKGSSYASGTGGPESKVSSVATNPNASKTAIMSQAGNPLSQSLAGNSIPLPINQTLPKAKPKKKRKPIKLWIPTVILASAYVIACVVYFVTGYDFSDKSVDIGKYYIAIGEESKKEYYDGQKFNFYELIMTYYWSNENIEEYDLTKFHMVEPTNSMGYTLKNGYINGIWDGDYAREDVEYRDVEVKFLYNEETCYVPVRIYKNVLTSLNCYSSIRDLTGCKSGDGVSVTVFGVYTNKVMVDEGINSIERKMDAGEYDLWIHLYRDDTRTEGAKYYKHAKLEFDATTNTYILPRTVENFTVKYRDTLNSVGEVTDKADDLKITANAVKDYNINCYTYDKYGVETFDKVENPSMNKEDKPFKVMTINSQLASERKEQVSARFNEPFTFSIRPNEEQGYTLRDGYSVQYNIIVNDVEYVYKDFKVLEKDELNNYRIEREEISGKIVIKVVGCSNRYNATFFTKESSSSEYRVYETLSIVKGGTISCPQAPEDTEYFKFLGWAERYANGTTSAIIEDWSTIIMGTTDRVFEAQYEAGENTIAYVSSGYEIVDLEGNPITSIVYGEDLTFKLKLKSGYSFGGDGVRLYFSTSGGPLQQIYADGHSTPQIYDEDHRYIIDGEALTGDLTFDLNMLYKVTSDDNRFTFEIVGQNTKEIRKVVGSANTLAHIRITLNAGLMPDDEYPILCLNGEEATYCPSHSSGSSYCYYISKSQVTDNLNITVSGIKGQYNIIPQNGDGGEVNFKVKTEDGSQELTTTIIGTEDLKFTVVANDGYDMTNALVLAYVNGWAKQLDLTDGVYTLRNSDFSGLSTDIVIKVTGVVSTVPTPSPTE